MSPIDTTVDNRNCDTLALAVLVRLAHMQKRQVPLTVSDLICPGDLRTHPHRDGEHSRHGEPQRTSRHRSIPITPGPGSSIGSGPGASTGGTPPATTHGSSGSNSRFRRRLQPTSPITVAAAPVDGSAIVNVWPSAVTCISRPEVRGAMTPPGGDTRMRLRVGVERAGHPAATPIGLA